MWNRLIWTVSSAIVLACPVQAASQEAVKAPARDASFAAPSESPDGAAGEAGLRDSIWRLERALRSELAGAPRSEGAVLPAGGVEERFGRQLRHLSREAGRLDGPAADLLQRKARALRPLLASVDRASRGLPVVRGHTWLTATDPGTMELVAGEHVACSAAFEVGTGSLRGRLHDGASEVWLRYTPQAGGFAEISTQGSDFDSVVEVYSGCSASQGRLLVEADDEVGLQARATLPVVAGSAVWVRVAGWQGATGDLSVRLSDGFSGISGTVTHESTGAGVGFQDVEVWTDTGSFRTSAGTSTDGTYLAIVGEGTYFVSTDINEFAQLLSELYDDIPCPGGVPNGCSATSGTPVVVTLDAITSGIDFAISDGARISGRVRDESTGEAIQGAGVVLFDSAGGVVGEVFTEAAGRYSRAGFGDGIHYAQAFGNGAGYELELYDGLTCSGFCDPTTGTPIPTAVGSTSAGIDFNLALLGSISGRLSDEVSGEVIFDSVNVYDSDGFFAGSGFTEIDGKYRVRGLPPGDYFVRSTIFGSYVNEVFDDMPCLPICPILSGTPVPVSLGQVTEDIDLALRREGSIQARVVDENTSEPIGWARVSLWSATGDLVDSRTVNSSGQTFFRDLPEGPYYLTAGALRYVDELYDDLPCPGGPPGGCIPTAGTPVVVPATGVAVAAEIDLVPLGAIEGRVTETGTGLPVPSPNITIWDAAGNFVNTSGSSAPDGSYRQFGLQTGTYTVTARSQEHLGELYPEIPCTGPFHPPCDVTVGTPIAVTVGSTATGVDFTLDLKGSISGTVRKRADGVPIPSADVEVFDSAGDSVGRVFAEFDGGYRLGGLDAGTYYAVATADRYDSQLFSDIHCPPTTCDPTTGSPIAVTLGVETPGIDFALDSNGGIFGFVRSNAGEPIVFERAFLFDSLGGLVDSDSTDGDGGFSFRELETGSYFLLVEGMPDWEDELYDDLPCPAPCDPTAGTPIVVTSGPAVGPIEVELDPLTGLVGRVVDAVTLEPMSGVGIDLWDAAGERTLSTATNSTGFYRFRPVPGNYYVSTDNGQGAVDEIYDDVACPLGPAFEGLCDPTTGQQVPYVFNTLVDEIDFALDGGAGIFADGFESGNTAAWSISVP